MKVRILSGESEGQVIDLPSDFATRLLLLGYVGKVLESDSGLTIVTQEYQVGMLKQPEDTSKNRRA